MRQLADTLLNSMSTYFANPHREICEQRADRFIVRLPGWAREIEATAYQLQLLQQFEQAASLGSVLEAYPFHRDASVQFLEHCIREQFLLPVDEQNRPVFPNVRRVDSTMFHAPHSNPETPTAFTIVGIPFDGNTTGAPGARFGPSSIRAASEGCRYGLDPASLQPRGFIDFASGRTLLAGVTISDAGDIHVATGEDPADLYDRITNAAYEVFESRTIPVFLGGDHSITYPILRAIPHDEIGIIHFDAHTDLGDVEATGLHHGNVFTMVLDRLEFVRSVHQVGLRGVYEADPDHRHARVSWMGIDQLREATEAALLEQIPTDRPYYLSVDIDVVDPAYAPSTGTPVAGGLQPHELKRLIRAVCEARDIVGMDLVEVGPALSPADSTANVAMDAILAMADGLVRRVSQR